MSLYLLVDEIAERFLTVVDRFDDDINELEDNIEDVAVAGGPRAHLAAPPRDPRGPARAHAVARRGPRGPRQPRRARRRRHAASPARSSCTSPTPTTSCCVQPTGSTSRRDLLAGVRDFHQAQVANDQNEVMKRLTVVASVLLLPTFIVGLYGQNLQRRAPSSDWAHGYSWSWFLIIVTTIAQLVYFRRKQWI